MAARVLIVDDEETIVEGLLCLLQCEAIEGSGAFDRLGAESLMEGTFYSVIVADLRLHTEAEGLELLDAIRRITPRSRVLTLTGFATMELDDEVLAELPDTNIDSSDDHIALHQALGSLSEESRAICILIAIKGYAYDEVSAITGLPPGSIGPMYLRAKSKMRQMAA